MTCRPAILAALTWQENNDAPTNAKDPFETTKTVPGRVYRQEASNRASRVAPLGRLMHLKCIHVLCIELLIFQSSLHHIRVISLFSIHFRNISLFSYFSGINPALAENPIFYIFEFQ